MGKRGPKPKPKALKKLTGSPRANDNPNQVDPPIGWPDKPFNITPRQDELWQAVGEKLYINGLLTPLDGWLLHVIVKKLEEIERLDEMCRDRYLVQSSNAKGEPVGAPYLNPLMGLRNKAEAALVKLFAEFGMTPASRTRIEVVPMSTAGFENARAIDPVDRMLGEG